MKDDHRSYICSFCSCGKKAWKKFRLLRDLNPWPLQYRCRALPIKLTSQLGAGHWIGSTCSQMACYLNNWQSAAPVLQRSRVRIPYKPEFFSGFLFATAKVAYITAMINLHLRVLFNNIITPFTLEDFAKIFGASWDLSWPPFGQNEPEILKFLLYCLLA